MSKGDPRFHALLKEIGDLHDRKQEDYGSENDPFANVTSSKDWGVPPWVGALVRLNDKVHRLQQFAKKGELANESAEDSMYDIAVYAIIALILYRGEDGQGVREPRRDGPTPGDKDARAREIVPEIDWDKYEDELKAITQPLKSAEAHRRARVPNVSEGPFVRQGYEGC